MSTPSMNERHISQLENTTQRVWEQTRHWHQGFLDNQLVGLYQGGPPNLMSTCFAVIGAECCGVLDSFSSDRKSELAELIKTCQDQESGVFNTYEISRSDLSSHSASYIRLQSTYFAIHALNALGERPPQPVELTEEFCKPNFARGWIDGGNWRNPWLHSNHVMFALTFLQSHAEFGLCSSSAAMNAYDEILDYLDSKQDSESGLWQPDDGKEDRNAAFAAYHFFPYYYYRERPLAHQPRIIDTLLSLIQPDGFFGYGVGKSGACEDLDVIHSLVLLASSCDHRSSDVEQVLLQTLNSHFQIQNSDGGFPNYLRSATPIKDLARNPRMIKDYLSGRVNYWHYSGWRKLACPKGQSDTWGGWFRPLSIKLIAEHVFGDNAGLSGNYRSLPGLGWHAVARTKA